MYKKEHISFYGLWALDNLGAMLPENLKKLAIPVLWQIVL